MDIEKRKRIVAEWDKIVNQDNLSDEEALNIVAKNAGVTYGETREVLCWTQEDIDRINRKTDDLCKIMGIEK